MGSMATVWHGDVTPRRPRQVTQLPLPPESDCFRSRGAEIGRFNMGSTVVLLFAPDRVTLEQELRHGTDHAPWPGTRRHQESGRLNGADWRPAADVATLRHRAAMLDHARQFFRDRGVLEVETPVVLSRTVTDVQLESLQLTGNPPRFLQTSPEYPMKRLLAAGKRRHLPDLPGIPRR